MTALSQQSADIGLAEKAKYDYVYANHSGYGRRNHAQGIYWYFQERYASRSDIVIADIGCGYCDFLKWFSANFNCAYLCGVDLSCQPDTRSLQEQHGIYFSNNYAWALPFNDDEAHVLTAFDVLEHIPPEMLHQTLTEFARVCKDELVFSIAYDKSTFRQHQLHLNIKPLEWWQDTLARYFSSVEIALAKLPAGCTLRNNEYFVVSP